MYNSDTELLFPIRVAPALASMRGELWRSLVNRVTAPDVSLVERMAFVNLMVKLGSCVGCNADSFRAMRGCTQCARQTIRRFRGSDQELIDQYQQSFREVENYLQKTPSKER